MANATVDQKPVLPGTSGQPQDDLAKPLHVQHIEKCLELGPFLSYVDKVLSIPDLPSDSDTTDTDTELSDAEGMKIVNGVATTKPERRADKTRLYNFTKVKKSRKWLKNILLSDSSSDEDDDEMTPEKMQEMLRIHKLQRQCQIQFYNDPQLHQYQYYSVGLLSNYDKYHDHHKQILGPKKKGPKDEQKKLEKKLMKAKLKKLKKERGSDELKSPPIHHSTHTLKVVKVKRLTPEQALVKRKRMWMSIVKKEVPKAQKQRTSTRKEMFSNARKLAKECMKESRRKALQFQRSTKDSLQRARRLTREMLVYWKRFEKVEKESRKKAEKEAQEQRKMDLELMEAKRQQRKLNFLITQTELYAHFMSRKVAGGNDTMQKEILQRLDDDDGDSKRHLEVSGGLVTDMKGDNYNSESMKNIAVKNATDAFQAHQAKTKSFDSGVVMRQKAKKSLDSSLSTPDLTMEEELPQPSIFEGKLKAYQLKGMNWLASLYNKGINGILADEMGLGKTVQSIALLSHLAEHHGIWGPFLVIAPASTLHNWQQEFSKFLPRFKVVPYWGNTQDRKILRSFWDQAHAYTEQSSFHVVITSYQLVIQDMKYFQKIKWIYMVLDEAQAIKSSSSIRWKMLLGFSCRNRLLLTGTPIQNSMAELWALLHFIMPTLFDSHDEFNEWFSKDIEGSVEKMSGMDENCLSRLHMILKPFMLRRVKKDVENELSDKIEILVYCHLTRRQKILYQAIKNKIRIEDLIQSAMATSASQAQSTTSSLMNLVMQFRKVCNHPELFERREVRSPFHYKPETFILPKRIYRECLIDHALPSKQRLLYNMFCIYNPENVHRSLVGTSDGLVKSSFSFLRFIDVSPQELASVMLGGLLVRWLALFLWLKSANRIYHQQQWHSDEPKVKYLSNKAFLLEPLQTVYFPSVQTSQHIKEMVFTGYNNTAHGFLEHTLHYIPETPTHRRTRLRHLHFHGHAGRQLGSPTSRTPRSPPVSPTKTLPTSPTKRHHSHIDLDSAIHRHLPRPPKVLPCQLTDVPAFLYNAMPKIACCPREIYCCDRSAAWEHMRASLCGSLDARNSLLYGTPDVYEQVRWAKYYFYPTLPCGMYGITPKHGYSGIFVPDKETLVTDAGKLSVLDTLLQRLKSEGHRVLIYSQMTRMIDLLEEYMWHRKHTYMRLDGSSKISDRRDMVADFQTRSDIFVFLLSTRAGGLGINLTAADTVIFYDSDWNPTVDQQAMDRAHRLGQTKQVTVYRLICKGSIEERILERAKEKSEIHRMVISGGSFRPDTLKPKEVVSLLLDDSEMTRKLKQKQEEKSLKQEKYKVKDRNRKREQYAKKKQEKGETVRKRKKDNSASAAEESNFTIPADSESMYSCDSPSIPPSPGSVVSVGSEQPLTIDESSNDGGLLIVDDAHSTFPPVTTQVTSTPKRGSGRRGRPRGSGMGRRPRGRGSITKALTAAEIAGAKAGKSAAFKAYGYSFTGTEETSNQSQTDSQGL